MDELTVIVGLALRAVLSAYRAEQLFLFGPDGNPFWAARTPVQPQELTILERALDLIAAVEGKRAKPFVARSSDAAFSIAALGEDSNLYLVVLASDSHGAPAEGRVALMRDKLRPAVEHLRTAALRVRSRA